MTKRNTISRRSFLATLGGLGGAALLAACGSAGSQTAAPVGDAATSAPAAGAAEGEPTTIQHLSTFEETLPNAGQIVRELSQEYTAQHPSVTYEHEYVAQTELLQKIQLLAGSNNLPTLFSYESGRPLEDMIQSGQVLDLEKTFSELDLIDKLNPAAVSLLKSLVGGAGLYGLPLELNVEGFWYNKQLFADNGVQEPKTWGELVQAADTFNAAGIQPFAASGEEAWPITRLINGYVVRKYGPDAMARVAAGELKVTDAGFVEAAKIVQDMGLKGYFGQGVTTLDYDTAQDLFLQGQAAMFYMGSWALRDFNDAERNKIGAENIGFFNIPLVEGGTGTADEYSMNAGLITAFSQAKYTPAVGDWMKGVFNSYGDRAMSQLGIVTGFKVDQLPPDMPDLTKLVLDRIAAAKTGFLWFEARFNSKSQTVATSNLQLLVTDASFTPEQYMTQLQQSLDEQ
jgi:raffinose/stachyose/melibiose transport system substrate-binding protein